MSDVAEWDDADDDVDEDGALEQPETFYGSADEFVREFLIVTYRREVSPKGEFRWDPQWWMHPEAVARLDALWRTWEHFRGDGATGMSVWWRDHADHHMGVLLSPVGPFGKSSGTTDPGDPLPYLAPPTGLFVDVRGLDS
ncbi:DUF4913 domain-containing protein [Frigoribacterium sp. CFBP 8754]|uniref:DUF4913 domain-containing protein n=1 Tax=Frigoribacterium sp. CFBP 8754 TaxID=2775290 RepID=UPI00177FE2AA|nr:DUF4913 domain-containing protein [Frigoribacterium sp. CFBP 8754]MBD8661475.1 DUF4913 domain-containing protein [Frigoribacterium sp. CFBP 8754]